MGVHVSVRGEVPCPGCGAMVNLNPNSEKKADSKKDKKFGDGYWLMMKCFFIAIAIYVISLLLK